MITQVDESQLNWRLILNNMAPSKNALRKRLARQKSNKRRGGIGATKSQGENANQKVRRILCCKALIVYTHHYRYKCMTSKLSHFYYYYWGQALTVLGTCKILISLLLFLINFKVKFYIIYTSIPSYIEF